MAEKEIQTFNGKKYARYPNSNNISDTKYFRNGGKYIHRDIWEFYNGNIPNGYQIHHIDHNPANNDISNLQLVKSSQHIKKYHKPTGKQLERLRKHANKIRHKASEWHKSKDGRKWHSVNSKKIWKNKKYKTLTCEYCNKKYQTRVNHDNSKFCSNNCKSAHRRKSGVDNEIRICQACNKEFITNKYSKSTHCSRKCVEQTKREK